MKMSQESSLHIPSRKHIFLEKNLQHKYKSLSWSCWNPESALQSFYLTQPFISTFLKGFLWDFWYRDTNTPHLFLQSIFRASYDHAQGISVKSFCMQMTVLCPNEDYIATICLGKGSLLCFAPFNNKYSTVCTACDTLCPTTLPTCKKLLCGR